MVLSLIDQAPVPVLLLFVWCNSGFVRISVTQAWYKSRGTEGGGTGWDSMNWDNKNWGTGLAWRTHAVNSSLIGKTADLELEKKWF